MCLWVFEQCLAPGCRLDAGPESAYWATVTGSKEGQVHVKEDRNGDAFRVER